MASLSRFAAPMLAFALPLIGTPQWASADGASIGLYTDATGTSCSFSGNTPGAFSAYVVFRPDVGGVNTVQFSAPVPSCLGAVYVGETVTPGMYKIGNSQTGVAILLQNCFAQPVSVLRIDYIRTGSTDPCCPYPILPDPAIGSIAASDCASNAVTTTGVVSHFNANAQCACIGNSPPTPPLSPVPSDGSPGHSVWPSLSWFAQDFDNNIVDYDVYLGTTPSPPLVAAQVSAPNCTPALPLAELTKHYWRVVVRDAFGLESSGPVWSFTTRVGNSAPFPPSNPFPHSTAVDIAIDASLSWLGSDIDGDPLTYDVYFGTAASPPLVSANQTMASYSPAPLPFSTTYYWRVVARDDDAVITSGPVWSFTTRPANFPPNVPSIPSPVHNAMDRPLNSVLSWQGGDRDGDAVTFDVYFGTSVTPPMVANNLTTTSFAPAGIAFGTKYYWRIVARDTKGAETGGPVWSFTTRPANYPPGAPHSPSPSNGATLTPVNLTLSWQASDPDGDPLTFNVYLGLSNPPPLLTTVTTASLAVGVLASDSRYYWRIEAIDSHGATTLGPTWQFTTIRIGRAPDPPSMPSPVDLAVNQPQSTDLSWTGRDPDGDTMNYDVYFGTTTPPPLLASAVPQSSYALDNLTTWTTYRWRVVARDIHGNTTTGPVWTFTTIIGDQPPLSPSAPSPANGANLVGLAVTLQWACSDPNGGSLNYDVYIGTSMSPPKVANRITTKNYYAGSFAPSTTHYWKIVARDPGGLETTGPIWSFTTGANGPPNAPFSPSPTPNSTNVAPNVALTWQSSDPDQQFLTHDVYFGTEANPPLLASNLSVRAIVLGILAPITTYRWRVVVRDPFGMETSGPVWSFTTRANSPPGPPSLPNPANNGSSALDATLSWFTYDLDTQPLTHAVYFGTTTPPPLADSLVTSASFDPGPLQSATRYYWRVVTSDGTASVSGPTWSFIAVERGDVVSDGQLTIADASCALRVYLRDDACGSLGSEFSADVDCNAIVTPGDARCIHRQVENGSCAFCQGSIAAEMTTSNNIPSITLVYTATREDTLIVRLAVAPAASMSSLGFTVTIPSRVRLIGVTRRGVTAGYTAFEMHESSAGVARVGGYALANTPNPTTSEFAELRFDISRGLEGVLTLDSFVDDLFQGGQYMFPLGAIVGTTPAVASLALHQNRPNPFNPQTAISYSLPAHGHVQLRILDLAGRVVRTLVDEDQGEGAQEVRWNGTDDRGEAVASGVYFYVLEANGERRTRKLVLLK